MNCVSTVQFVVRRLLISTLLFACIATLVPGAQAEEPTVISGVVTTVADGHVVPGVTVSIEVLNMSTVTGLIGTYELTVPAAAATRQTIQLRATLPGLQTETAEVTLRPGSITVDIGMKIGYASSEVVVVGSRAPGIASEKAVPVDFLSDQQLTSTGFSDTSQAIQALAPSFNFPRPSVSDGTDTVKPATLRGLGPDQVLVLVNGKRRHTSALVHVNNSIGRGSTGVDFNAIPVSAVERIEILRDGAAAQYGSDAIAGVINVVLKSEASPLSIAARGGMTTESDGEAADTSGTYGFKAGAGSVFIAAEYRHHNGTNRARPDPRDQIKAGDAGNNPVSQPNHWWGDPDTSDFSTFANASFPLTAGQDKFFYAFGGYSRRSATSPGFYRRALDARNWPSIYPQGFLPLIEPDVVDASAVFGMRGVKSSWFWDLSVQYGHNRFDFTVSDSLNTSMGPQVPPNQTEFDSGGFQFNQIVTNADLTGSADIGLARPVSIGLGFEFRRENYEIRAGEPASYMDGGVPNQSGGKAAIGAQVFPGFRPSNVTDRSRNSSAVYGDMDVDLTDWFRIGVAGRFEHYGDFGNTADGKLTLRLQAHPRFVVRGAANTGFRAPSLAQSYFSSTATNFLNVPGQGLVPFESLTLPVDSPAARALGAQPLKPENSVNYSGGVVWTPTDELQMSVDYYRVEIEDRIVLTGNLTGPKIAQLLAPFGANSARFFTNAVDTRTQGVDITLGYRMDLRSAGALNLSAAYNTTENKIVGGIATPPQLAEFQNVIFDRIERRRLELGQPKNNLRLTADWRRGAWTFILHEMRYGEFGSFTAAAADDQTYGAKWITDFDLSFSKEHYEFGFGIQNLFDVYPDETRPNTPDGFFGIFPYPRNTPFGFNGRFVYGRVELRF